MICDKAMELMSAALDNELSPEEQQALEAHLNCCADCRRLYEAMRSVDEEVSALEEPAPAGLKQGVMYRIGQESGKTKPARKRFFGVGTGLGAVAAVLVLLIGTGVIRLPRLQANNEAAGKAGTSVQATAAPDRQQNSPDLWAGIGEVPQQNQGEAAPEVNGLPIASNSYSAPVKGLPVSETAETCAPGAPMPGSSAPVSLEPDAACQPDENGIPDFVTGDARRFCRELSAKADAPVLFYAELTPEGLFQVLEKEEPRLAELVTGCSREEAEGYICLRVNWQAALALQEWLLAAAPGADAGRPAPASGFTKALQALDPDENALYTVISFPDREIRSLSEDAWPADWPEGWSERLLAEQTWALFLPAEDASFGPTDDAWLAFPAQP